MTAAHVCTLLVEALSEDPEKSICNLTEKTIHSITVHDFPDKWSEILLELLGKIYFNNNKGQSLLEHNAQPAPRKVRKKY